MPLMITAFLFVTTSLHASPTLERARNFLALNERQRRETGAQVSADLCPEPTDLAEALRALRDVRDQALRSETRGLFLDAVIAAARRHRARAPKALLSERPKIRALVLDLLKNMATHNTQYPRLLELMLELDLFTSQDIKRLAVEYANTMNALVVEPWLRLMNETNDYGSAYELTDRKMTQVSLLARSVLARNLAPVNVAQVKRLMFAFAVDASDQEVWSSRRVYRRLHERDPALARSYRRLARQLFGQVFGEVHRRYLGKDPAVLKAVNDLRRGLEVNDLKLVAAAVPASRMLVAYLETGEGAEAVTDVARVVSCAGILTTSE